MNANKEIDAVRIARALGDATRFSIYKQIAGRPEMRFGNISPGTAVRQSTISHHLKVLGDEALIESRREGQGVYYRVVPQTLHAYCACLLAIVRRG